MSAIERDRQSKIERFKARLAKGCTQRFDVDYQENISAVTRYNTIGIFSGFEVRWKVHVHHTDVAIAYINVEFYESNSRYTVHKQALTVTLPEYFLSTFWQSTFCLSHKFFFINSIYIYTFTL